MPSPTDSATHIGALDTSLPQVATCTVSQLDDFIRHVKSVLKTDFANVTGAVTSTHTELNYVAGVTSALQTQLNAGLSGRPVLITDTTISGSPSSVDFTTGIDGTYDEYWAALSKVLPGTDGASLYVRTSTNAGVSFDAGASDYHFAGNYTVSSSGNNAFISAAATQIQVASTGGGSAAGRGTTGVIRFWRPSAAEPFQMQWLLSWLSTTGNLIVSSGAGMRNTSADVDAIRFLFSSGTMASGRIKLFGRKV